MRSSLSLLRNTSGKNSASISKAFPVKRILISSQVVTKTSTNSINSFRNLSNATIRCNSPQTFRQFSTSITKRASAPSIPSADGVVSFNLADIGEGIAECEVLKWFVKEGDTISQFDPLCEVQSDKATVEITSRFDGVVKKLHYTKGQMAKVGSPLVDILTTPEKGTISPLSASSNLSPVISPLTGADMSLQGNEKGVNAASAAFVAFHDYKEDNEKAIASPAVRHLARKHNINLKTVKATGKEGRILKEDVLNFINDPKSNMVLQALDSQKSSPSSSHLASSIPSSAPASNYVSSEITEDRVVPLSGYSRIMAKTMVLSNSIPHFGYCDEIVADGLIQLRKHLKKSAEEQGVKLTFMPIIIKATSMALSKYPSLNSSFNEESSVMVMKGSHNIGVAMNTPNGLVVPNIKDVQRKSILEIARELNRLQTAASAAALQREDLSGGTFSISNIGTIGGTYTSPVIVPPEVAIGAIGKIQKLPRYDSHGNVVPQHIFNISWSADHRVIDGATIANFSNLWKDFLENPTTMLFQTK